MTKFSRLAGVLVGLAMVASAGCASNSGVTPASGSPALQTNAVSRTAPGWINDNGVVYHTPHYMGTRDMARPQVNPDIQLVYSNGPVLTTPKMYIILWGYKAAGDPDNLAKLLKSYAKAIGGSGYNNIYTQYYGPSGNITNPKQQFGGVYNDQSVIPAHPTDAQIAAEAVAQYKHFNGGVLDVNGSYVVATAHNHSSTGFATQWCAYHSAVQVSGQILSYTNLPYMPDGGSSCGANIIAPPNDETGTDEGMTIVEGHEYGESVTDPNPPTGWYNNQYGEIGDICAWQNIQNDPYKKKSYTAQPMFSNASSSCVHSYP